MGTSSILNGCPKKSENNFWTHLILTMFHQAHAILLYYSLYSTATQKHLCSVLALQKFCVGYTNMLVSEKRLSVHYPQREF